MLSQTILEYLLLFFIATLLSASVDNSSLKTAILDRNWDLVNELSKDIPTPRNALSPISYRRLELAFPDSLLEASSKGHLDIIVRLVEEYKRFIPETYEWIPNGKYLRIKRVYPYKESFVRACSQGHTMIIDWYLQHPEYFDIDGLTVRAGFSEAVYADQGKAVATLIQSRPDDIMESIPERLLHAASKGNISVIEGILGQPRLGLNREPCNDAVMASVEAGHAEITALLLSDPRMRTVSPAKMNLQDKFNQACIDGDLDVVKQATLAGADPTADLSYGFIKACELGHLNVVEYLWTRYRMEAYHGNFYALRKSVENGHRAIFALLLEDPDLDNISPKFLFATIKNKWETEALVVISKMESGFSKEHMTLAIAGKLYKVIEALFSQKSFRKNYVWDNFFQDRVEDATMMNIFNQANLLYAIDTGNLIAVKDLKIGLEPSIEALNLACELGHSSITSYLIPKISATDLQTCIELAATNGHVEVMRNVLIDGRIGKSSSNQVSLFVSSLYETEALEVLLGFSKLNPAVDENYVFRYALEKNQVEAANRLFMDPRVRGARNATNLVLEVGVKKLLAVRANPEYRQVFENYLKDWKLSVPTDKIYESLSYPHPQKPEPMEMLVCNAFFDSHSFFFEEESIFWSEGTQGICDIFQKMLIFASKNAPSPEDESKLLSALEPIQELRHIAEFLQVTNKLEDHERVAQRIEFIQLRISQMKENERLHVPLCNLEHAAIGFLEKSDTGYNWYMFNSGDGTASKVESDSNRQHMIEIFYGISQEWFCEMFSNIEILKQNVKQRPFRDRFYPKIGTNYLSKATIRGQRSGTCQIRCFQLFLLCTLGRPLYTKFKFVLLSNLLENVYSSLSAGSSEISYLGVTFQSYYMPVWAMVREVGLFEEMIESQIGKLDSKPVVSVSCLEPDADEAYKTDIEETKQFCWRIHDHLRELNRSKNMDTPSRKC